MAEKISRRRFLTLTSGIAIGAIVGGAVGWFGRELFFPPGPPTRKEIVVASMWPRSGSLASIGLLTDQGVTAAATLINDMGGIQSLGGAKIKLIHVDATSDPKTAAEEAERVINIYQPVAIIGNYASAISLEVSRVADQYKIPQITSSISDKLTARGLKYLFQTSPKATQFGNMQIEALVELGKLYGWMPKRLAIVYEDTAYGTDTARGIRELANKVGLEIVLDTSYPREIKDATDLVLKIKESKADVVTPVSYIVDAILITNTMHKLGVKAVINGGGAGYLLPEYIRGTGEAGQGVISVSAWQYDMAVPGWPEGALEINKYYRSLYPNEPYIMEHAGEAFGDLFVLADAIERAGSADPSDVVKALAKTNLDAADTQARYRFGAVKANQGKVIFDETGWNKTAGPVMMQIQGNDMVTIYPPANKRPGVKVWWPPWKRE